MWQPASRLVLAPALRAHRTDRRRPGRHPQATHAGIPSSAAPASDVTLDPCRNSRYTTWPWPCSALPRIWVPIKPQRSSPSSTKPRPRPARVTATTATRHWSCSTCRGSSPVAGGSETDSKRDMIGWTSEGYNRVVKLDVCNAFRLPEPDQPAATNPRRSHPVSPRMSSASRNSAKRRIPRTARRPRCPGLREQVHRASCGGAITARRSASLPAQRPLGPRLPRMSTA
ncbi:hypothetical protein FDG2_5486 [Candidatus Protofrankia californiensis]|uniref:Uncharacterized protein n=1 Tax=Candidatus Protofrankia californiensis TaxID=1839754 RepID=A0A1C3PDR3_9ACTN|nr:hypothetical protein FDG2_5486 [Candidatus Protofrankia californiensis]